MKETPYLELKFHKLVDNRFNFDILENYEHWAIIKR